MNIVEEIAQYLNERNKAVITYLGDSDDFSEDNISNVIMGIVRDVSEEDGYDFDDIYVIADASLMVKFQRSLKDYSIMEGSSISNIGDDKVNLDFHKYRFAGKNIHIAWYESNGDDNESDDCIELNDTDSSITKEDLHSVIKDLTDNEIDSSVKFEFVDDREHYVTEEDIINIFKDVFKNYGKVK